MKIIITGGAGFVGSHMAIQIKKQNPQAHVVAFDNLKRRGSELQLQNLKKYGIEFAHGDIRIRDDLFSLGRNFDLMIEASAEPSVHAGSEGSPDYLVKTNLFGTYNCLEFVRNHCESLIFLSTSRVYSIKDLLDIPLKPAGTRLELVNPSQRGLTSEGISEDFQCLNYRSLYGATKLCSEMLIQEYQHTFGLKAVINRCGVIAGPGQWGKVDQGVFTLWVAHHFFEKPLRYTGFGGEGLQVRDLLHPQDLYRALEIQWQNMTNYAGGLFNLGGGLKGSTSLQEFTKICEEVTSKSIEMGSNPETAPNDIPWFVTDYRKFERASGWRPEKDVRSIVKDIFHWLQENEKQVAPLFRGN